MPLRLVAGELPVFSYETTFPLFFMLFEGMHVCFCIWSIKYKIINTKYLNFDFVVLKIQRAIRNLSFILQKVALQLKPVVSAGAGWWMH